MASIILGSIGAAIGGNLAATAVTTGIGKLAGVMVGSLMDQALFGAHKNVSSEGFKLNDLQVQTSNYGSVIPIVYGTARIAGNIIWTSSLQEHNRTESHTQGGKWNKVTHVHTEYHYTISIAIAICKGEITAIDKIWADDIQLEHTGDNIRIYLGTKNQLPDPLMESIEGKGSVPAYRGMAYVVFENLNVTDFANRLPQFTFEVRRALIDANSVENMVSCVNIIPGSGEFVYDTVIQQRSSGVYVDNGIDSKRFVQRGKSAFINCHAKNAASDSVVSLDLLKSVMPNIRWISVVVTWFVDSLDADRCNIVPGVEFTSNAATIPDEWQVAGYRRNNAYKITCIDGRPIYGGTVNDLSIIRYLTELKKRNYKIMFYPMLMVDTPEKPWRGRIHGTIDGIGHFFQHIQGYNNFILHYATLVDGLVDAFLIGSEMVKLTTARSSENTFPAVTELINLAEKVRSKLGRSVKLSYAADWSEYHHTDGGWYHLDPLWASENIDFVGVDAYFPLTSWSTEEYDLDKVIKGWDSGEGSEFYYDNDHVEQDLDAPYAWKNIEWWWKNKHVNPNGKTTEWQPKSKKIWFTEYGFPSVELSTNQPNRFFDPNSAESGFPRYSNGNTDFISQRIGIGATERRWKDSEIVENKFLWAWDARPYPTWPDRSDIWSDGLCWEKGHWVQGKFGCVTLAALLQDLCKYGGLKADDLDFSGVANIVEGLVIADKVSVRQIIEMLQHAYFFDVAEIDYCIKFIPRTNKGVISVQATDLVLQQEGGRKSELFSIKITEESALPNQVDINFCDRLLGYKISTQYAKRVYSSSKTTVTFSLPLILSATMANYIAHTLLYNAWTERTQFEFILPIKYLCLSPTNVIQLKINDTIHKIRVTSVDLGQNYQIQVKGVTEDHSVYQKCGSSFTQDSIQSHKDGFPSQTALEVIDIPPLPNESIYRNLNQTQPGKDLANQKARILVAISSSGEKWYGCKIEGSGGNSQYNDLSFFMRDMKQATMGYTINEVTLPSSGEYLPDRSNKILVNMIYGQLSSIDQDKFMCSENLAILGDEVIQFQYAELIDNHQYEVSYLLRGIFDSGARKHQSGTRFIFLNSYVSSLDVNLSKYRNSQLEIRSLDPSGYVLDNTRTTQSLQLQGRSKLPLKPTHVCIIELAQQKCVVKWYAQRVTIDTNNDMIFKIELFFGGKLLHSDYVHNVTNYEIPQNDFDAVCVKGFCLVFGEGDGVMVQRS